MPKRARESVGIDTSLVEIWEDLAHEDERFRIKAAHRLLTSHIPNAEHEHTVAILRRLFRGLCSSRKAARLGFSIALTETLTYLKENKDIVSIGEVLDILESQTVSEANTTGQDERDHYFGRLFASDAVIKSGLLFTKSEFAQWQRLLDIICGVSAKKPWLRQECGWILFSCVQQMLQISKLDDFAVQILEKLTQHQLIRSPEGLALWISIHRSCPDAKLPKKVWKHDDPLAAKEAQTLAKVLMDAKTSNKEGDENEVQGSATWSGQLHFVWDVVLSELAQEEDNKQRITFGDFWKASVDDGLFAPAGSSERKHWGLMLLQKAFTSTSPDHVSACFSRNAINCLMQSLKTTDRYLQKSAQRVLQALQNRFKASQEEIPLAIAGILIASNMTDFDAFTKTKTLETWFTWCHSDELVEIASVLKRFLWEPDTSDTAEATTRRKNIISIQFKLVSSVANQVIKEHNTTSLEPLASVLESWMLATQGPNPEPSPLFSDATLSYIRERISLAFEQALKLGRGGQALILQCIGTLKQGATQSFIHGADSAINDTVNKGWLRLSQLEREAYGSAKSSSASTNAKVPHKTSSKKHSVTPKSAEEHNEHNGTETHSMAEGIALLYGLTMFQVYNNDTDAISVLGDLLEFEERAVSSKTKKTKSTVEDPNADGLVEIILSFASRPSKFLRRMTLEIFANFTSQITDEGLQSLIEILETKETKAGQEQLFQVDGQDGDGEDIDGENDSDVEMVDSDVEMVSEAEGSSSSDDSDSGSDSGSDDEDGSDEEDEASATDPKSAELMALEASLAAALGTRKLTTDDLNADSSSSDSDSDMTDSEMMALDEKLADVFRARQADSNKKNDQKSAKENIVNFKNRVLDMIEVYLRCEVYQTSKSPNPNSLRLLMPLLTLARTTNTKQLSNRGLEVIKTFCGKCKGLHNVPTLASTEVSTNGNGKTSTSPMKTKPMSRPTPSESDSDSDSDEVEDEDSEDDPEEQPPTTIPGSFSLLHQIHTEASLSNTSNIHKATCSQASLLVVKVLVKAGAEVTDIVDVYANTRTRMLLDSDCHVSERFFVDWGNWCGSVKGKLGVGRN